MSEASTKSGSNGRGAFYRVCRMLHGYLSAAAFLALLFFAGTGILLNHPEWMPAHEATPQAQTFALDGGILTRVHALNAQDQVTTLATEIGARADVLGAFSTGEVFDSEALLRFEGPRGNSTATVDLSTGAVDLQVERADALSMLNDFHRGKNAGAAWKLVIDIVGGLTVALSLIGFVIFFSLRFRLVTSMVLVGAGAAAMVAVYVFLVR